MLRQSVTKRLPLAAALLSGLILGLAFPPVGQSDAAWFALVPLLLALKQATPRGGFSLGWSAGLVFWLGNLAWLWRLIGNGGPLPLCWLGHGALAAYCAPTRAFRLPWACSGAGSHPEPSLAARVMPWSSRRCSGRPEWLAARC